MSSFLLFHLSDLLDYDELLLERAFLIHSSKVDVLPEFHNLHAKPRFPELNLSTELVYIGRTSITWLSKLFDLKTDEVFVTKTEQTIGDKYAPHVAKGKPLRLPTVNPPDSEDSDHVCEMVGSWYDVNTDFYFGYEHFFKFGMHGIMDAVANDKLILFKHDIQKYHIKNVDVRYLQLVNGGDNIKMFIRQNKEYLHVIDVALRKEETVISQMTFVFEI